MTPYRENLQKAEAEYRKINEGSILVAGMVLGAFMTLGLQAVVWLGSHVLKLDAEPTSTMTSYPPPFLVFGGDEPALYTPAYSGPKACDASFSGTLDLSHGGTGISVLTKRGVLVGNGTSVK